MRTARIKADIQFEKAHYHCLSRVVDRRFALGDAEKEQFVQIMRGYERFCGVTLLTFCVLSNHFHALVEVPRRPPPEQLPSDRELVERVAASGCASSAATLEQDLARFRAQGHHAAAEELRERFFRRMWDISWFMRLLKQRFTQWLNSRDGRAGTLWEGRFRSVLVEGSGPVLAIMAAYIDLNPIRAGIVDDPKDYRWSGYCEAVAGGKLARAGLALAIGAKLGQCVAPEQAMALYRAYLYESGQAIEPGRDGQKGRRGFTQEQIDEVLKADGKIEIQQALLCRVRYFCAGAVLGSRAFVERVFESNRSCFGLKRQTGARSLRQIDAPGLFVARDLRVRPLG